MHLITKGEIIMSNFNAISLNVKCPLCGKSLMDHEVKVDDASSIKLVITQNNKRGNIYLSSVYGSYNLSCDIELAENEIAVFACPHCREEITTKDLCEACQAPMSLVVLDMGGKIHFCSRRGCTKHSVEFEDLALAMKKLYQDYDQYSG